MSFEQVVLSDIQVEKTQQAPVGTYVFQLLPTAEVRTNKFTGVEELNLSAAIAEGDYKGRRVFWNYPDPATVGQDGKPFSWSAQAMKKLEVVLGEDAVEGESAKDYFNRVAASGNARFTGYFGPNAKKPYTPAGADEPRNELNIFSIKPSA
jgi:hypothetical protein